MRFTRLLTGVAGGVVMALALSSVVAADDSGGQTGHYIFTDTSSKPGAACYYTNIGSNTYQLYKISARPPSVWWPDTSSSSSTQHGPVGQQVVIRHKHASSTTWSFLKQSSVQHATAYEDHPLYDPNDKAPFTRISLSISAGSYAATEQFRANVWANWYRADGSRMGYAVHVTMHYAQVVDGFNQGDRGTAYCPARFNAG